MATVVRPYRGVSATERRSERRTRLKQACLDLVGEGGVAAITAAAVSERAGLTKRYFYESFADRDALLYEVMDDFFTDVRAEILEALGAADPAPAHNAHVIASVLIDFLHRDARRARLYIEAPGHPTLQGRREQAFDVFTQLLLDTFPQEPLEAGAAARQRRALAALIVVAGTTQAAISWLQGNVELGRADVINEIARMITTALLGPRTTRRTG